MQSTESAHRKTAATMRTIIKTGQIVQEKILLYLERPEGKEDLEFLVEWNPHHRRYEAFLMKRKVSYPYGQLQLTLKQVYYVLLVKSFPLVEAERIRRKMRVQFGITHLAGINSEKLIGIPCLVAPFSERVET